MPSILEGFFDQYRRAFAQRDEAALLELLHLPCLMMSGTELIAVGRAEDAQHRLRRQFERHTAAGVADARFEVLVRTRLTPRLTRADLRWSFSDAAGEILGETGVSYTLVHVRGRWSIATIFPLDVGTPPPPRD